jgi:hypothetical protein
MVLTVLTVVMLSSPHYRARVVMEMVMAMVLERIIV